MNDNSNVINKIFTDDDEIYINEKTILGLKWNPILFFDQNPIISIDDIPRIQKDENYLEIYPIINSGNQSCSSCEKKTEQKEKHFIELEYCIETFLKMETPLNIKRHKCPSCNKVTEFRNVYQFSELGKTLIMTLNRNKNSSTNKNTKRNRRPIKYPLEIDFSESKYRHLNKDDDDSSKKYYLSFAYGKSQQNDSNYQVFIRNVSEGFWYEITNEKITKIENNEMLLQPLTDILIYQQKEKDSENKNTIKDLINGNIIKKIEELYDKSFENKFKSTINNLFNISNDVDLAIKNSKLKLKKENEKENVNENENEKENEKEKENVNENEKENEKENENENEKENENENEKGNENVNENENEKENENVNENEKENENENENEKENVNENENENEKENENENENDNQNENEN